MGLTIERDRFEDEEYERFGVRLERCLESLSRVLERPGWGVGVQTLGAELEVALVDADARPLPLNVEVLRDTFDPRMTVELNRFNLESNLRHTELAGQPFSTLREEMESAVAELSRVAALHRGRVVMIGVLPTLVSEDLQSTAMTDTARFRALSWALQRARLEPFRVRIDGDDPLEVTCADVTFEGAATSLQLHLRVDPQAFARTFNAVQLATVPALAVAGNSPTFLGHRLWEETRVALFKQAVDDRDAEARRVRRARVSLGNGWIRGGALELFESAVRDYDVLLPVLAEEDPLDQLTAGEIPRLEEIRLHQGTVWSWNRPVYDAEAGGHLRIEMRALPAGPTPRDMLANAAFLIGLALGLAPEMESLRSEMDFADVRESFYRAAQSGLSAQIAWPTRCGGEREAVAVRSLVARLLPIAERGLAAAGVAREEIDEPLSIIAERCGKGQTGAVWQRRTAAALERTRTRGEALAAMLERYLEHSSEGEPVHRWPLPA